MAGGTTSKVTEMSGLRRPSRLAGPPIALDTGLMFGLGAGHGWKMNRGASLRSTMAVGPLPAAVGAGSRDRWLWFQFIRQPWSHSLVVVVLALASAWEAALAGSRLLPEKFSCRGIAPAPVTCRT